MYPVLLPVVALALSGMANADAGVAARQPDQPVVAPEPAAKRVPVLESIVVRGQSASAQAPSVESRHGLDAEHIDTIAATTAAEIVRRLPSVHVPTNSRGESIAFLRNAGERQVAIFYEGAAINIPWDNRLDLSLVPAGLIGSVQTAAGPLAPHYGVSALGALSLSPKNHADGGRVTLASGSGGLIDGQLFAPLQAGATQFELGGGYEHRRGDPVSDDAALPYSQSGTGLRTNTDGSLGSVFAHADTRFGDHRISLTAFHVEAEKGIAPESDRARGARFWRYPEVSHTLLAADAISDLNARTSLDSTVWYQDFGQTIDSYTDASYAVTAARQIDQDHTVGLRELLRHVDGPLTWIGSFNFLSSRHRQRDIGFSGGNPPATLPDALLYSQRNWSVGGDLEWAATPTLRVDIGAGVDNVDYVDTGDKPPIADVRGWTGRAGIVWDAGGGWSLRAALGRKMRAPTMRELFGQALNRFLINPDLKPERIVTAEFGAEWRGKSGRAFVIPFVQDLDGTIDQRNVGPLRQRINLKGSRVRGIEIGGDWQLDRRWRLLGSATWSDVRKKGVAPGQSDRLAEKPDLLARIMAEYNHPAGVSTSIEAEHVGRAYSLDAAGVLMPLARSTSFNWRGSYAFASGERMAELFVRIDNLTDTVIEPQLGLPAPGRSIRIGIRLQ